MAHIIAEGEAVDPRAIQLATRKGRFIRNRREPLKPPSIMRAAVEMHTRGHDSRRLRSASSQYNCMGMVFASRRTVVDVEQLPVILEDDGYTLVRERDAQLGDILVYKGSDGMPAHVGVVFERSANLESGTWRTIILSQWGSDGEYFHDAHDVPPLCGEPAEFWSDRS